jgi:hypothetical protein
MTDRRVDLIADDRSLGGSIEPLQDFARPLVAGTQAQGLPKVTGRIVLVPRLVEENYGEVHLEGRVGRVKALGFGILGSGLGASSQGIEGVTQIAARRDVIGL